MSATTAAAVKVLIEGAGLGLAAYRDRAPEGTARPYVTISDGISIIPDAHGDAGDPDADVSVAELIQVDLWERLKSGNPADYSGASTDDTEDPALLRGLLTVLRSTPPTTGPTLVYAIGVDQAVRLVEHDTGVVRHAITVRVRRRLDAFSA